MSSQRNVELWNMSPNQELRLEMRVRSGQNPNKAVTTSRLELKCSHLSWKMQSDGFTNARGIYGECERETGSYDGNNVKIRMAGTRENHGALIDVCFWVESQIATDKIDELGSADYNIKLTNFSDSTLGELEIIMRRSDLEIIMWRSDLKGRQTNFAALDVSSANLLFDVVCVAAIGFHPHPTPWT